MKLLVDFDEIKENHFQIYENRKNNFKINLDCLIEKDLTQFLEKSKAPAVIAQKQNSAIKKKEITIGNNINIIQDNVTSSRLESHSVSMKNDKKTGFKIFFIILVDANKNKMRLENHSVKNNTIMPKST